ncbi:MAG TPA: hypothetical protein VFS21_37205 [Roseiflexaceae bacterium]|nr:hypothetical protein [Roseiflexaceae bacterium]
MERPAWSPRAPGPRPTGGQLAEPEQPAEHWPERWQTLPHDAPGLRSLRRALPVEA